MESVVFFNRRGIIMRKKFMAVVSAFAVLAASAVSGVYLVPAEDGLEVDESAFYAEETYYEEDPYYEDESYYEDETYYADEYYNDTEASDEGDDLEEEPEPVAPAPKPEKTVAAADWTVYGGDLAEDLTEEDRTRFNTAVSGLYGEIFQPITILGSQIVSGVNYAYLCRTVPISDYAPDWKIAVVYEDLQEKVTLTSVRDLHFDNPHLLTNYEDSGETLGAWKVQAKPAAEDAPAAADGAEGAETKSAKDPLPQSVSRAFSQAIAEWDGNALAPVSLLAYKKAGDEDYLILARSEAAEGETPVLYLVQVLLFF